MTNQIEKQVDKSDVSPLVIEAHSYGGQMLWRVAGQVAYHRTQDQAIDRANQILGRA